MKAIIEFNFPEDQAEYDLMLDSSKMFCSLIDIEQMLRGIYKYDETLNQSQYDIVEKIREEFYDILKNNNLNLNK